MSDPTNDDILNDLLSIESSTKGKKKKGPAPKKAAEPKPDLPKAAEPEIKEEPKQLEIKEEAKAEENPENEGEAENAEDQAGGEAKGEAATGEKKKKKVIVKKVVKKKMTEKDMMAELLKKKMQEKKELEEKAIREAEEKDRLRREEEEKQKKIGLEKQMEEERIRKLDQEKIKELKAFGIKSAKDIEEMNKKLHEAEEALKKQGIQGGIEEMFENLKHTAQRKKKKKPVAGGHKKEEVEGEGEANKDEEKEEIVDTKKTTEEANVPVSEEFAKLAEKEIKFEVSNNAEEIDDWENFDEDGDANKNANEATANNEQENQTESHQEDESSKSESTVATTDNNKREKVKPNKKGQPVIEEEEPIANMKLRSPVICILGHVDTGKTKILDKLRKTNVQEGEAGGITQQIGATFFPIDHFRQHLDKLPKQFQIEPKVPGFLVIDTPGHESFQNLRQRGQSLCDLAVLVVDLMHGLQKQTLDSLDMLRKRKTPFVIAFNKIDRIHNWKSTEWGAFRDSYEKQKKTQTREFDDRFKKIVTQLIQTGLNVSVYDENPSMKEYINIIPTSAVTGEGMPDLIGMFLYLGQKFLYKKLEFKNEIQCTILEVKVLEKTGTTIDVILVNGFLNIGDKIILGGLFGPIRSTVKILMTPHPMKEMRIKSEYEHHESISGAMGIKIFGNDLDNALAGSPLFVYHSEEEAEKYGAEITSDFNSILKDYLSKTGKGILVQASTLGSLEAILSYLHEKKIEIAAVGLGYLQKKDVTKIQIIHAKNDHPLKEHLTVLAFDIKILPEAQQCADDNGIKIFTADIIYHLFDNYIEYEKQCINERKKEKEKVAVFPSVLKIIPSAIFNRKDPIIIGVDVVEGILKVGTPLIVPDKKLLIGTVEGIESNKKQVNNIRAKDGSVAIRIKPADASITVGRHFEETDSLVSNISRDSINALKEFFRDDMTKDDWQLIIALKKQLEII